MRRHTVAVLGASVVTDAVELRGIGNRAKELRAQRLVAADFGIEDELCSLGVTREARADLLVVGCVARTLRIAHAGGDDARHALEVQFCPPEAATSKCGDIIAAVLGEAGNFARERSLASLASIRARSNLVIQVILQTLQRGVVHAANDSGRFGEKVGSDQEEDGVDGKISVLSVRELLTSDKPGN